MNNLKPPGKIQGVLNFYNEFNNSKVVGNESIAPMLMSGGVRLALSSKSY